MERLKVIVLAAGTSTERDVSIVSGTRICAALRRNGHRAEVLDVFLGTDKLYDNIDDIFDANTDLDELEIRLKKMTPEILQIIEKRKSMNEGFFGPGVLEACKAADIVFMGLHGANGEDGKIQGAFDLMGIKYTGTGYLSSAISMNKRLGKLVMTQAKVPMPAGIELMMTASMRADKENTYKKMEEAVIAQVGFPCVVKPCCGGSSVGVSIVMCRDELITAFEAGFALEDELLVEEYIKGREFSVGIVDNRALPVVEIAPVAGFYDYKNKYVQGMTNETCPADIPSDVSQKMQEYAVLAARALGLETYGRIDCLLSESGKIYCLEMNTLPGMTGTSLIPQEAAAEGMGYDELCDYLIEISLKKYI